MLKRSISAIVIMTFIFSLGPMPSAMALRQDSDSAKGAQAVGEALKATAQGVGGDTDVTKMWKMTNSVPWVLLTKFLRDNREVPNHFQNIPRENLLRELVTMLDAAGNFKAAYNHEAKGLTTVIIGKREGTTFTFYCDYGYGYDSTKGVLKPIEEQVTVVVQFNVGKKQFELVRVSKSAAAPLATGRASGSLPSTALGTGGTLPAAGGTTAKGTDAVTAAAKGDSLEALKQDIQMLLDNAQKNIAKISILDGIQQLAFSLKEKPQAQKIQKLLQAGSVLDAADLVVEVFEESVKSVGVEGGGRYSDSGPGMQSLVLKKWGDTISAFKGRITALRNAEVATAAPLATGRASGSLPSTALGTGGTLPAAGERVLVVGDARELQEFIASNAQKHSVKISIDTLPEATDEQIKTYDLVIKKTDVGYQLISAAGAVTATYTSLPEAETAIDKQMGIWA